MNTHRNPRPKSKGFRVVSIRTGKPVSVIFPRREGARDALQVLLAANACPACGAQSGTICTKPDRTPYMVAGKFAWDPLRHGIHTQRSPEFYGIEQVKEYDA